jgi:hypothetical protein
MEFVGKRSMDLLVGGKWQWHFDVRCLDEEEGSILDATVVVPALSTSLDRQTLATYNRPLPLHSCLVLAAGDAPMRELMGFITTVVNTLPRVVAAATSAEARELAGVVSVHMWRAAPQKRPDPKDFRVVQGMGSVLAHFTGGTTPDAKDARHVRSHIGAAI